MNLNMFIMLNLHNAYSCFHFIQTKRWFAEFCRRWSILRTDLWWIQLVQPILSLWPSRFISSGVPIVCNRGWSRYNLWVCISNPILIDISEKQPQSCGKNKVKFYFEFKDSYFLFAVSLYWKKELWSSCYLS